MKSAGKNAEDMPIMADLEYEAKNVNQAVEKAAAELNISPEKLDYDVVSHGSSGIFGLARVKKAKIRVVLPEEQVDAAKLVDRLDHELSVDADDGELKAAPTHGPENSLGIEETEKSKQLGFNVLKRIVDTISDDAQIQMVENREGLLFSVKGRDAAILIGKRGQTLEAIQSLVEKIVNKHSRNNGKIHVQVDVEGYLQTRQENLEKLAQKLAAKSKRIGKPIALSQMSAYERRIIHMALKNDHGVRTKSRGEGYLRKLVIFPKKKSNRSKRPSTQNQR
jgi:spoIIIJ-associated protein